MKIGALFFALLKAVLNGFFEGIAAKALPAVSALSLTRNLTPVARRATTILSGVAVLSGSMFLDGRHAFASLRTVCRKSHRSSLFDFPLIFYQSARTCS